MTVLNENIIASKQKSILRANGNSSGPLILELVETLNLWGSGLTNIGILKDCKKVRILSLVVNRISDLEPLSNLIELEELYLRENNIDDFDQIRNLAMLPELKILGLEENPISSMSGYREIIIQILPNLKKLDAFQISEFERREARINWPSYGSDDDLEVSDPSSDNFYSFDESYKLDETLLKTPEFEAFNSSPRYIGYKNPNSLDYRKSKESVKTQTEDKIKTGINHNLLVAALSLIRELDDISLDVVQREIEIIKQKI